MPHRLLEPLTEAGALSWLYVHMQTSPVMVENWTVTPERFFWVVGGILFCGFYSGKFWREFVSTKSKVASDYAYMKEIKASLAAIERQLDRDRAEVKQDLIARRALVDKEVTVLTMGVAALERRADKSESRHGRLNEAFNRFVGLASPVLRDADLDTSRVDIVSKVIGLSHGLPDESSEGSG